MTGLRMLSVMPFILMAWGEEHITSALTAGCLALLPFAGYDVAIGSVHLSWLRILCLVLLGALGTGYAYLLNYRTLQAQGATAASLVTYLIPVVGVAAGVLVLGEPFSYRLLLGAVVVGFGIALIQGRILGPRTPEPEPEPATVAAGAACPGGPGTLE